MRSGHAVPSDQFADALWVETAPASAAKVVHGCIFRLRTLLGRDAILTVANGYRLAVPAQDIDARRFETLVGRARGMLSVGEPERTEYLAGQALALWRGPAYAELEEWEQGRIEADRLNELRLEAEELRVDACLRSGRFRDVLADAQSMVREAPMRERRWGLLALAHYQAGNQSEALRIIRHIRTTLAVRHGLDANPELGALERAILRQEPALAAEEAQPTSYQRCPYLGLRSYEVEDSESFFGRDDEVSACLRRLELGGSLAVIGASGSGKSSLVRAGIAASLRRAGCTVAILEPGSVPSRALATVEGRTRRHRCHRRPVRGGLRSVRRRGRKERVPCSSRGARREQTPRRRAARRPSGRRRRVPRVRSTGRAQHVPADGDDRGPPPGGR